MLDDSEPVSYYVQKCGTFLLDYFTRICTKYCSTAHVTIMCDLDRDEGCRDGI